MRALSAFLLLTGLLFPAAAISDDQAYFRLGVNWDGQSVVVPPDGEPNDDEDQIPPDPTPNSPFTLTYPGLAVAIGQDIGTLRPTLGGELSTTTAREWLVLDGEVPEGLFFNSETGDITGAPTEAGVISMHVTHIRQTIEPNEDGSFYLPEARAQVEILVGADFAIEVTPQTATFQLGQSATVTPITVSATTNPPQTGGTWGIARNTAYAAELEQEIDEPALELSTDTNTWPGTFQFYYQPANGARVFSPIVTVDVAYPPYWDFRDAAAPTYQVYWSEDLQVPVIEVLQNQTFKVQPYAGYGAVEAPAAYPGWVPHGALPTGVSISSTGAVKGTATTAVGTFFQLVVPARTTDNRYGWSEVRLKVVDQLVPPGGGEDEGECDPEEVGSECYEEPDPEYFVAYHPSYKVCPANRGSQPSSPYPSLDELADAATAYKDVFGEGLDEVGTTRVCAYQVGEDGYDLVAEWGGDADPTGFPPGYPILITFQLCLYGSLNNGIHNCNGSGTGDTGWGGWESYGGYFNVGSNCNPNGVRRLRYFGVEDVNGETDSEGYLGLWLEGPEDSMPAFLPEGTDTYTIGNCGYRFYTPQSPPPISWPFSGY